MAKITVHWGNQDKTLIYFELATGWQACDLYIAMNDANKLAACVDHTVYLLMVPCCSHAYSPPGMIGQFASIHRIWHPHIACCVHVLPQYRQRYEFQILYSLNRNANKYHRVVQSLDDAYELLDSYVNTKKFLA